MLDRYHGDLVAIATDAIVAEPLARWASARAGAVGDRSTVHRYRVDHPGAGPQLRATHTVEVPLVFGTWQDGGPGERLGGQAPGAAAVSADLVSAWGRFVHGEAPGWPAVAPGGVRAGGPCLRGPEGFAARARGRSLTKPLHTRMPSHWTQRAKVCTVFPRWAQMSALEGET